jgi:hypothetical protein
MRSSTPCLDRFALSHDSDDAFSTTGSIPSDSNRQSSTITGGADELVLRTGGADVCDLRAFPCRSVMTSYQAAGGAATRQRQLTPGEVEWRTGFGCLTKKGVVTKS